MSRSRRPRGPRSHDAQERQPSIQEQTLGVLQSIYAELHAYRQERTPYRMQGLVGENLKAKRPKTCRARRLNCRLCLVAKPIPLQTHLRPLLHQTINELDVQKRLGPEDHLFCHRRRYSPSRPLRVGSSLAACINSAVCQGIRGSQSQ